MIILFGGRFNPPHVGHRIVAESAYDEMKPEEFFILPTPNPPHKSATQLVSFDKRYHWCKRVFWGSYFTVSDIEAKLPVPSYTFQTLQFFSNYYSDIWLLIGEDSLRDFKKWYKWEEILKLARLLVYPRYFDEIGFKSSKLEFVRLYCPIIDISSSYVRDRIEKGKTVKGYVDDSIVEDVVATYKNVI